MEDEIYQIEIKGVYDGVAVIYNATTNTFEWKSVAIDRTSTEFRDDYENKLRKTFFMRTAVLVSSDDWEGLYIDGELISEDHNLDEPLDWIRWTNKFNIVNLVSIYLDEEDRLRTEEEGSFPELFSYFVGNYKIN